MMIKFSSGKPIEMRYYNFQTHSNIKNKNMTMTMMMIVMVMTMTMMIKTPYYEQYL